MNRPVTGTLGIAAARPAATREARSARGFLIAAVICIAATTLPNLAYARGGGGMGGGFHGGGGGFHAAAMGGFHGGGFHAAAGGFHGGHSGFYGAGVGARVDGQHGAEHDGRYGGYGGWWGYDPYLWSDDGPYTGNDASETSDTSQYWYCANPAGYYPYVTQCSVPWQSASAN